jgi:monoamine oxidase
MELGAEFIHGLPRASWDLIREARLATEELDGAQLCFEEGRLQHCGREQSESFEVLNRMSAWLAQQPSGTDLTFAQYLGIAGIDAVSAQRASAYVEGFNAADRNVIGIAALARQQQAEDAIEGDRLFHLRSGYREIPKFLADQCTALGGRLFLQSPVDSIEWRPGFVAMRGTDVQGRPFGFEAKKAVISLPLGVLQSAAVKFAPAPGDLLTHAAGLTMGSAQRISLLFKSKWWTQAGVGAATAAIGEDLNKLSFVFARGESLPTWWTSNPSPEALMTGWVAGPRALALRHDAILDEALLTLSRVFSRPIEMLKNELLCWHSHDWQADPYSRGAYSYAPANALAASDRLAQPIEDTLYFAGEHTDTQGHWGTVHAALQSGLRAAAEIALTA